MRTITQFLKVPRPRPTKHAQTSIFYPNINLIKSPRLSLVKIKLKFNEKTITPSPINLKIS